MHSKLILFDVDGTLLSPGPIPRQTMQEAISDHLEMPITLDYHDVAGFTDPTIIQAALRNKGGVDGDLIEATAAILASYLSKVTERLAANGGIVLFDGARELVLACQGEGWATALLTGNVEIGARAKVEPTGLWNLFAFGAWGDDGAERVDLPPAALKKAATVLQQSFAPEDVILIGDTPQDARIGRLNNIQTMIVCRRPEPEWREAIEAESPTWVVDDFSNVPAILSLLRG